MSAERDRSRLGLALRSLGVLALVGFLALLVYGLLAKAPDTSIDEALSRSEAMPAPGFELQAFGRGRPRGLGARWDRAAADGRVDLRELRGTPVVINFHLDYPDVRDPTNATSRKWGATGIPETYFVSANGKVVGHIIGTVTAHQLDDGVAAALSGRPRGADQGGEQRPTR